MVPGLSLYLDRGKINGGYSPPDLSGEYVLTEWIKDSVILDERTFVIIPEPGISLNRIPILTNLVITRANKGKNGFKCRGFGWGRLPLLVDRLKVDTELNSRLLGYFNTDLPDNLRNTALPGDRLGITTSYRPQRLPSRDFLACIEDIADHIHNYLAERNRTQELRSSK